MNNTTPRPPAWSDLHSPWTLAAIVISCLAAGLVTSLAGWNLPQQAVAAWAAAASTGAARAMFLFGLLLRENAP